MEFIINNWQFLFAIAAIIGGYADQRSTIKQLINQQSKTDELVAAHQAVISENEKLDAVRENRLVTLERYKASSEKTKDEAVQKLSSIEGMLNEYIRQSELRIAALERKNN
ncbi:MAG: hypothetical protein ACPG5O_15605 [Pseudoalteromonas tetraodonis]